MKEFILENWQQGLWIIFGSGVVCEITPFIKFNPISLFLNWLGKKLNKDVEEKLNKVEAKVDTVQADLQSHKVESWRRNILNFADELMRSEQKSKENYDSIIKLHDEYEKYIKQKNIENGQIDLAFSYISTRYKECRENNSFYTGK